MALENATNATVNAVDTFSEQIHHSFKAVLASAHQPWIDSLVANPYLFFVSLVLVGFALSYLIVFLSRTVIKAFTLRTETDLDDKLLSCLTHPVAWFLFLLSLSVALVPLSLTSTVATAVNRVLISLTILVGTVIVERVVTTIVVHYGERIVAKTESTVDDHLLPILRKVIKAVIICVGLLIILNVWGVQLAPLLAGAGIVGVAVAFSMQETLKNLFGGASLAFDRVYSVGDRIKLQDGTTGKVLDITLRSTKIRSFDGNLIVVPNGKIANEMLQTFAQPTHEIRVLVPLSVAYGTDLEKAREVILKAIKGISHQIEKPKEDKKNTVEFHTFGPYGIDTNVIFWVEDYTEAWDARLAAVERIYAALAKAKIEIPYPTQIIHARKG